MPAPPTFDLGSGIDTQDVIRKLIEIDRQPLKRLESDNQGYDVKIKAWEALGERVKDLSTKSRDLYSVLGVFNNRLFISSNPAVIDGTVASGAQSIRKKVIVEQLASRHEIHTNPIAIKKKLPLGNISVKIGDIKKDLKFTGGDIEKFKDFLNEELGDHIEPSLISAQDDTIILKLRSKKSGENGNLEFEDHNNLLIETGLVEPRAKQTSINFQRNDISSNVNSSKLRYKVKDEGDKLEWSNGTVRVKLRDNYTAKKGAHLSLNLFAKKGKSKDDNLIPKTIENLSIGPNISAQVGELKVSAKPLIRTREIPLEGFDWKVLKARTRLTFIYEDQKGNSKRLSLSRSLVEGQSRVWKIPLSKLPANSKITALDFNTNATNEIQHLTFNSEKELQAINEIQPGRDAIIKLDGVPLRRPSNQSLSDIIPGVSLTLKEVSKKPVNLEVKVDDESIIKKIKDWVGSYNVVQTFTREAGRSAINVDIAPPSSGNQDRNQATGGIFATDSTIRQLTNQSYNVVAAAYPANAGGYRLLSEIGVSTGRIGSRWQDINDGLLKIEDEKLKKAVNTNIRAIQRLFGSDNNNDIRLDNGIAFNMEKTLKPYLLTDRGLISVRIGLLKTKISSNKDRIAKKEDVLERKKISLRLQFGRMERAVQKNRSMGKYLQRANSNSNDK